MIPKEPPKTSTVDYVFRATYVDEDDQQFEWYFIGVVYDYETAWFGAHYVAFSHAEESDSLRLVSLKLVGGGDLFGWSESDNEPQGDAADQD